MTSEHLSFATESGGRLDVVCDQGSVSVRTGPAGSVEADISLRNREAIDLRTSGDGRDVRIEARVRRAMGIFPPWESPRADIDVTVPAGMVVDVRGANTSIEVNGIAAETRLATTNGRIGSADTRGALTVSTTNGAVTIEGHAGVVRATAQNGAVVVRRVDGTVEISTTNGKIDLEFVPAPGSESSAETTNGSVMAAISGAVHVAVDARTVRGSTVIENAGRGSGEAEARLRIRTTNGSIRVVEGRVGSGAESAIYI